VTSSFGFGASGESPPQGAENTRLVRTDSPTTVVHQPTVTAHLIAIGHRRVYSRSRGFVFERTLALDKDLTYLLAITERLRQGVTTR
jgi:hypothetical protein